MKGDPFASPTSPLAPLLSQSTSPPCRPKGLTGQRAMVNHAFVTDHPQPHPACCPLRRNLAGRVLPLTCYDANRVNQVLAGDIAPATAWLRAWPEPPQPVRSTPWWHSRKLRERAPVQRIHNQHSSACVGVLVHQTGHSQREVVADGRRSRSLPRRLDPRGRFFEGNLPWAAVVC